MGDEIHGAKKQKQKNFYVEKNDLRLESEASATQEEEEEEEKRREENKPIYICSWSGRPTKNSVHTIFSWSTKPTI